MTSYCHFAHVANKFSRAGPGSSTCLLDRFPAATLKHGAEKRNIFVELSAQWNLKRRNSLTTSRAVEESFEIERKHRLENMADCWLRLRVLVYSRNVRWDSSLSRQSSWRLKSARKRRLENRRNLSQDVILTRICYMPLKYTHLPINSFHCMEAMAKLWSRFKLIYFLIFRIWIMIDFQFQKSELVTESLAYSPTVILKLMRH